MPVRELGHQCRDAGYCAGEQPALRVPQLRIHQTENGTYIIIYHRCAVSSVAVAKPVAFPRLRSFDFQARNTNRFRSQHVK